MKRKSTRLLATLLAFVMVTITIIPFNIFASTNTNLDYTPFMLESSEGQAVYNEQTADMCYDFYIKARNFIDGKISEFTSIEYNGITYPVKSVLYVPSDNYPTCDMLTCILNMNVGGTAKHVILIAFRGTDFSDLQEVMTDFDCDTGVDGYHDGFEKTAQKHYENLMTKNVKYNLGNGEEISFADYVEKMSAGEKNYQMIATGHSLGAAVAGVFTSKYLDNKNNITAANAVAYTFASPLTVSESQAAKEEIKVKNIFNITNTDDIVTKIGADIADGQRTGQDLKYKLNKYDTVTSNLKGFFKEIWQIKKYFKDIKGDVLNNHRMGAAYLPTKNYINDNINKYTNYFVLYNNYDSVSNTYQRVVYENGKLVVKGNGVLSGNWRKNTFIDFTKMEKSCTGLYFDADCSITEIGDKAFSGMSWLKNQLELPNTITKIGNYAFFHCGFTGDLKIPSTMVNIGINSFNGCSSLKAIYAQNALHMEWGYGAFSNCVGRENLHLPTTDSGTDLDYVFKTYNVQDDTGIYWITLADNTSENVVIPGDNIFLGRIEDEKISERPHYEFHYLLTTGHTDTSDNIKSLAIPSIENIASVDEFGCVRIDELCAPETEFTVVILDNIKGEPDYDVYDSGRFIHFTVSEKNINFSGGLGTEQRPYLISNYGELNYIRNDINAHYQLVYDIDCSGYTWTSIGSDSNYFAGIIDGNGYSILNLTGDTFIACNSGHIKNLTLENAQINNNIATNSKAIGIITGKNSGIIEHCQVISSSVTGYVKYNSAATKLDVGGLSAVNNGKILNSSISNTALSGNSRGGDKHYNVYLNMGGIAARTYGESIISNCTSYNNTVHGVIYHNGTLDDKSYSYFRIGGVIGFAESGEITLTEYYNNKVTTDREWYDHWGYEDGEKSAILKEKMVSQGVAKSSISFECTENSSAGFTPDGVTSIKMTGVPKKTHYYIGEPLNLYGLEITDQKNRPIRHYTVSGYNNQCSGEQTISIYYTNGYTDSILSTEYTITVENIIPETIVVTSKQEVYEINSNLDVDDFTAVVYYNDGSIEKMEDLSENASKKIKFTTFSKLIAQVNIQVIQLNYHYAYMTSSGEIATSPSICINTSINIKCDCLSTKFVGLLEPTVLEYGYSGDKVCLLCDSIVEEGIILDLKECTAHIFDQQIQSEEFLKNTADCINSKSYYYSCICGKHGVNTFNVGNPLGHSWSSTYSQNAEGHYRTCTRTECGVSEDSTACSGGTATCTDKAVCSVCNTVYGIVDVNNHAYSSTLTQGDTTHYYECSRCHGKKNEAVHEYANHTSNGNHTHTGTCACGKVDTKACSGGTATCTDKAVCSVCNTVYGIVDVNNHSYASTLTQGDTTHYYECSRCHGKKNEAVHEYANHTSNSNDTHTGTCVCGKVDTKDCSGNDASATCQTKAVCTVCGSGYGSFDSHDYNLTAWGYKESDGHAHMCKISGCTAHDTAVQHTSSGAPTEDDPETCTICQFVINPATGHIHHTPVSEWSSNATHHWKECVGCSDQEFEKGAHVYDNACDTTCNTCEYVRQITHNYTYKHNDTQHWQECSVCGDEKANSRDNHSGGNATCTDKAICTYCSVAYGEKNSDNHTKSTYHYTTNSNGTHKKLYDCCNATANASEACSGGNATCQAKAVCQHCNTAYGEIGAHNYDLTTWGYKAADGHAHVCKTNGCNAHDTVVAHTSSGAPTEANAEICTVCQYVINPALAHTTHIPKAEWSSDATHHWHECTGCSGQQLEKAEHIYDNACDTTCNTCGYERTVTHNYTELKHSDTEHWYECVCGAEKADSRVAHSGGTATCTAKAKCSVCNTEYGTVASHSYATEWSKNDTEHWHECACGEKSDKAEHAYGDDNVCDACGYENESQGGTEPPSTDTTPAPVDPGTNSNDDNGGMIAEIIIACVVALGGGGFAFWWFVFKKKRI